ncbi:MAG: hypothetical protein DI538_21685 [Azospira oryzae]|nr:MAG: hypothetical protein DI538_21685 [Azospira oryzae]
MKAKAARYLLLILLAFLGLGAVGGGGVLIVSPDGQLMGMPSSVLEHSPFSNFLIPGIILFFVLGILPCLLIVALIRKQESIFADRINLFPDMHWTWTYTIYVAFALIIWIQMEMVFLKAVHWLHTFYMFYAVAILCCALLPAVRRYYSKEGTP